MASVIRQKNGRRMIQFIDTGGKRSTIRLGKVSQRQAEAIKIKVENLVASKLSGHAVDDETARWVAKLDSVMAEKLASVFLISKRSETQLGRFIDSFIRERVDVKPRTQLFYEQVRDGLIEFFGISKPIHQISPGDAESFRLHLIGQGLAENTVRRRCGQAKSFFKWAMRNQLISNNPFADIKSAVRTNHERFYYVSREEAERIIDACPDSQWRLLFALSRYGGLRCPSEHLSLRWSDIDWSLRRICVKSPKTEHHPGGESRIIPLFPELHSFLEESFELAEPGTEFVITRYRSTNANLRTQLLRIIKRAGLNPWPKLFQNLRSTRETELAESFPMHVVCRWIGNTQPVAQKHYLQITDEHFERAVGGDATALQNALQSAHATHRTQPQPLSNKREEPRKTRVSRGSVDHKMRKRGLEPPRGINPTRPST